MFDAVTPSPWTSSLSLPNFFRRSVVLGISGASTVLVTEHEAASAASLGSIRIWSAGTVSTLRKSWKTKDYLRSGIDQDVRRVRGAPNGRGVLRRLLAQTLGKTQPDERRAKVALY